MADTKKTIHTSSPKTASIATANSVGTKPTVPVIVTPTVAPIAVKAMEKPVAVKTASVPVTVKPLEKPVAVKSMEKPISVSQASPTTKVVQEKLQKPVKKVLFVTGEALPFAASGGLGEVAGSLPRAINEATENGYDVRVIMPLYKGAISQDYQNVMEYVGNQIVSLAWRHQYCGVFRLVRGGVTYYFIDNEYYFKRANLYGEYDDGERFAFFAKAVLEVLPMIGFYPNVIHCNDWQTALVPVYYKLYYMFRYPYEGIKTVFTIHNIEYQGKFGYNCCEDLFGIPARECGSISHGDCINLMKAAIDYADAVTTVSPTYANEIRSDYFAHGLAPVIAKNAGKLRGILNGIDTVGYDSATDKSLFFNFDTKSLEKKVANKLELQKMLNLEVDEKKPMIAIISRLVAHKGVDLIKFAVDKLGLMQQDVQLVVLGTGNGEYEAYFTHLCTKYPKKVAAVIAYNKDLSRKIYGAADIFLMPSKSEPCGLSQMIASRYGTVPVVRETGGLFDSIQDCNDGKVGNGYTFATYDASDLVHALERAIGLYRDFPEIWKGLVTRIMNVDFSWKRSAKEYVRLYTDLIGN